MQRISDIAGMFQGVAKVGKSTVQLISDDVAHILKTSSLTSSYVGKMTKDQDASSSSYGENMTASSPPLSNSEPFDQPKRSYSTVTANTSPFYSFKKTGFLAQRRAESNKIFQRNFHLCQRLDGLNNQQLAKLAKLKKVRQTHAESNNEATARNVEKMQKQLTSKAKESKVPSTRMERIASFGGLAAGLAMGAVADVAKTTLGVKADGPLEKNALLNEANMNRIVATLCKVRGAALKLGQMLSIQDDSLVNPKLLEIFDRVRQSADFMPFSQIESVLIQEFGSDWRSKLKEFDEKPFAAASIGQVHKAVLLDGSHVAMKIQYPGVADSINSDIDNLMTLLKFWKFLPEKFYVDEFIDVTRRELAWECDYEREARFTEEFRERLKDDEMYGVPRVIKELSGKRVITSELITGNPIDKVAELDQDERNFVSAAILRLVLRELFEFRTMQTDPNWANFFYNEEQGKLWLLDFGATRTYSKEFVDSYIEVVKSAAMEDREKIISLSEKLGFLTGLEPKVMVDAHVNAILILGEPFKVEGCFDFRQQSTSHRVMKIVPTFLEHRLTAPPEETYSLHRKLSGAFLISMKLRAEYACKAMFDQVYEDHHASLADH